MTDIEKATKDNEIIESSEINEDNENSKVDEILKNMVN